MTNEQTNEWGLIVEERAKLEHIESRVKRLEKAFIEKNRTIPDGAIVKTKSNFSKSDAPMAKVISARFDYRTGQILYTIVEQWSAQTWEFSEYLLTEVQP